ncbi:hypothetical protein CLAIMM_14153 [Cladophialophora immunda]|nr:hypothetical protein CLAIMM_14153 [Cladophialophora immunda]
MRPAVWQNGSTRQKDGLTYLLERAPQGQPTEAIGAGATDMKPPVTGRGTVASASQRRPVADHLSHWPVSPASSGVEGRSPVPQGACIGPSTNPKMPKMGSYSAPSHAPRPPARARLPSYNIVRAMRFLRIRRPSHAESEARWRGILHHAAGPKSSLRKSS